MYTSSRSAVHVDVVWCTCVELHCLRARRCDRRAGFMHSQLLDNDRAVTASHILVDNLRRRLATRRAQRTGGNLAVVAGLDGRAVRAHEDAVDALHS